MQQAQASAEEKADEIKAQAARARDEAATGWQAMKDRWQSHVADLHGKAAGKKAEMDQAKADIRAEAAEAYAAGLDPADWTRLRHSFVSLMSDAGVPIEIIARIVGHTGVTTTEAVYRKQIRPVVIGGAEVMNSLFPVRDTDA